MYADIMNNLKVLMEEGTMVQIIKKNGTTVTGKIVHFDEFAVHVRNVKEQKQDIVTADDFGRIEAIQAVPAER